MIYILLDLKSASRYVPVGLFMALMFICIRRHWMHAHHLNPDKGNLIAEYILFAYSIAILFISLLSREPGSRHALSLIPLSTWGVTPRAHAYVIENILMFIPLGFLLPLRWSNVRKLHICILIALISSLAIELTQVITQRGYGQTDDVLTNVLGAMIGFAIWKICNILNKFLMH